MKILVVSGSPRSESNTELMAEAFAEGARSAGHDVDIIRLSEHRVLPCLACDYCFTHDGACVQRDDMDAFVEDLCAADALVFASPIYWFGFSGQLKCFVDRLYAFTRRSLNVGACALLLNSQDEDVFESCEYELARTCAYLGWENRGALKAPGMKGRAYIEQTDYLDKAREFGRTFARS